MALPTMGKKPATVRRRALVREEMNVAVKGAPLCPSPLPPFDDGTPHLAG